MPVYEYLCQKCGHEFEREQRISDAPVKTCPKCRARQAKRLISQTSFVLKGGGWYSDLYGSSKAKAGKKDPSEGGSGTSKSESKSDSKSDTKADPKGESASKGSSPKSESKSAA